jgi:hypothetical protein
METNTAIKHREPWNKGKLVGQKVPFKPKEIWSIRTRLQMEQRLRELALFDLGLDSKLRGCDLVRLRLRDVCHGDRVATRAIVLQQKTQRPVPFEITPATRVAVEVWIKKAGLDRQRQIGRVPAVAAAALDQRITALLTGRNIARRRKQAAAMAGAEAQ